MANGTPNPKNKSLRNKDLGRLVPLGISTAILNLKLIFNLFSLIFFELNIIY